MVYLIVQLLSAIVFKLLFRIEVTGRENVPSEGAIIIAANHKSYLDPLLMAYVTGKRQVNSMAKASLFRFPIFGSIIRGCRAFPVKRGIGDKAAIAHSLKV